MLTTNMTLQLISCLVSRNLESQFISEQSAISKQYYNKNITPHVFHENQQVLLDEHYFLNKNKKISPKFTGPHLILKLKGDCNVELLLDNGKTTIVHVNRLKTYKNIENLKTTEGSRFSSKAYFRRSNKVNL
jgi:hypothetical protein